MQFQQTRACSMNTGFGTQGDKVLLSFYLGIFFFYLVKIKEALVAYVGIRLLTCLRPLVFRGNSGGCVSRNWH